MLARKYKDSGELLVNIRKQIRRFWPCGSEWRRKKSRFPSGMTNRRAKARAKATAEATADSLREWQTKGAKASAKATADSLREWQPRVEVARG